MPPGQPLPRRVAKDLVTTDPAPPNCGFAFNRDPLEGRASVRAGERPRQLPDPRCGFDTLHPKLLRPAHLGIRNAPLGCRSEFISNNLSELLELRLRQAAKVSVESWLGIPFQRSLSTLSRYSRNSSVLSKVVPSP